jgi:4,5-DOPA dioxygenase extradiol
MSNRKSKKPSHHSPQSVADNRQSRRAVLAALGALGVGAAATIALQRPASVQQALGILEDLPATDALPVVFVGHGTPFSIIDPNVWTREWSRIGGTLPRPAAILMISAHWLTSGASLVTASAAPQMNYDISGFPSAIYEYRYPAPGHPAVAREVERALQGQTHVQGDTSWGLDHGTWLPLKYMFPAAEIPVLQLSIDYSRPPAFHYELAKRLRTLRSKGVLIIGSGNVVHNLGERGGTGVTETPRDWAVEFDRRMAAAVASGRHAEAIDFLSLGSLAKLAHPTYDHFLPFLYSLGLVDPGGPVQTFCEGFQWPGISMRSFVLA